MGEKAEHQCRIVIFQTDKNPSAIEDAIQECDVFFPILTESYLTERDCLMELAWAMKHKKKVQPLHVPLDKKKIGHWISMAPEMFRWIFAINFHPVLDTDARLLAGTLPTIISDANNLDPCPPLPDGCSAEDL